MRRKTVVRAPLVVAWLSLACTFPARCQAQSEASPDVYDVASQEPEPAPAAKATAARHPRGKSDFGGQFVLPYEVQCAGRKLAAGRYSLAVDGHGRTPTVSLTRAGETLLIPAKAVFPSSRRGGSAVVVWRAGSERKIEAVYVDKLRLVFYLDSERFFEMTGSNPDIDRLPIS
jgi:hypothetical protein